MTISSRPKTTQRTPNPALGAALAVAVLLAFSTAPALAHVELDAPNGGETLEAGSVFTIVWHENVEHQLIDFDLWYSTSGPGGPWNVLAFDLNPIHGTEGYTFDWVVPDHQSSHVRLRVRQDNSGEDYLDVSDSDLTIVKSLSTETVTLEPSQDAALYEGDGSLANGAGDYLFTGRTEAQNDSAERRAVLAFELADAVPTGSTITSVSLEMTMSKTISGAQTVELRRVLESWSEGPSHASGQEGGGAAAQGGDVTWVHRDYPDIEWSMVGGALSGTASGTQEISGNGSYTWSSTPEMVADVQSWLENPTGNYGWALVMPSAGTGSSKRFNSRENATSSSRPQLTITYEVSAEGPTAAFIYVPSTPQVGDTVSFSDMSTGSPTTWSWDFGDGNTSDEHNPTHVFDSAGAFTVSLTVSNDAGSDTATSGITVLPENDPVLTEMLFIPAAANAEGSGGSFFVSTADVHNAGVDTASFRLLWLPRNTNNVMPEESAIFTLEPGAVRRFDNLLGDVFNAVGAIGAVAVLSDSQDLKVMSRTFNDTEDGTFGQSIPGVAAADLIPAGAQARLLFLTENDEFRTNLGLVNGIGAPITVQWELFAADGASLDTGETQLRAWENRQILRVLADFAPIEAAYADVWTITTGGAFTCYGSVLDELSSDPTTVLPQ